MTVIRLLKMLILTLFIVGCCENMIYVTNEQNDYRSKYIEVLRKNNINFAIKENGEIIIIGETYRSLEKKTMEYSTYVREQIEKENKLLKEKGLQ